MCKFKPQKIYLQAKWMYLFFVVIFIFLVVPTSKVYAANIPLIDSLKETPLNVHAIDSLRININNLEDKKPARCIHHLIKLLDRPDINEVLTKKEIADYHFLMASQLHGLLLNEAPVDYIKNLKPKPGSLLHAHYDFIQGLHYLTKRQYHLSYEHLSEAKKVYEPLQHHNLARLYGAFAFYYDKVSEMDKSVVAYKKALDHITDKNKNQLGRILSNYSYALFHQYEETKQEKYLQQAEEAQKLLNTYLTQNFDPQKKIGYLYGELSLAYYYPSRYTKDEILALVVDGEALIAQKAISPIWQYDFYCSAMRILGADHVGQYRQALRMSQNAISTLPITRQWLDISDVLLCYKIKGDIHYKLGEYEAMEKSYQRSQDLAAELFVKAHEQNHAERKSLDYLTNIEFETQQLKSRNKFLMIGAVIICIILAILLILSVYIKNLLGQNEEIAKSINLTNDKLKTQILINEDKNQQHQEANRKLQLTNASRQKLIDRLKNFASLIVQDFKEPIRTISNYSGLLALHANEKLEDNEMEYLSMLKKSTARLSRMLNVLREVNTNTISVIRNFETVELREVVEDARNNLELKIANTECKLQVISDLPIVFGQYELLLQVFQNLIANAIKFTPKDRKPKIKIHAEYDDLSNQNSIYIDDNGIGVDEEEIGEIFTLFKRSEKVEKIEGQGIGLAVCKEIIELHGGTIKIINLPLGGARIHIKLPVSAPSETIDSTCGIDSTSVV